MIYNLLPSSYCIMKYKDNDKEHAYVDELHAESLHFLSQEDPY